MMRILVSAVGLWAAVWLGGCASGPGAAPGRTGADETLDALHRAAATADEDVYFDLFTDDAIFLGTDATERWTVAQFRDYAWEYFTTRESAWVYEPVERWLREADGVMLFEERLVNAKYGECRGTGALVREGGRWRIAQYNLTVPIPNDLLQGVADQIRAAGGAQ